MNRASDGETKLQNLQCVTGSFAEFETRARCRARFACRCLSAITFLRLTRGAETIARAALRPDNHAGLVGYIDGTSAEYAGGNSQHYYHFFHGEAPLNGGAFAPPVFERGCVRN